MRNKIVLRVLGQIVKSNSVPSFRTPRSTIFRRDVSSTITGRRRGRGESRLLVDTFGFFRTSGLIRLLACSFTSFRAFAHQYLVESVYVIADGC